MHRLSPVWKLSVCAVSCDLKKFPNFPIPKFPNYLSSMKASTVHEIKQELLTTKPAELAELCLRLARFKKENKELLTYLLFEAHDEESYVAGIKQEISEEMDEINSSQLYFAKKSLRRIVRLINKYCRYSGKKETELALRIHFCSVLKESDIPIQQNAVINNLYISQLKKIHTVLPTLHEDIQYDYRKELEGL
jgi:hypothetical protein